MIIKKIFIEKVDYTRTVNLSEMLYLKELSGLEKDYAINIETGLSYFGEYLERHIQTKITVREILCAVGMKPNSEFKDYQVYNGQIEMFLERVERLREEEGSFNLDLVYAIFLQKMKLDDEFNTVIDDILKYLELNEEFLMFTLAIKDGYLNITEKIKSSIVKMLEKSNLTLDLDRIAPDFKKGSKLLESYTELYAIKHIFNTYDLKKNDFPENPERLNVFRALKKFGTKDTEFELSNKFLCLNKQEFYYLALKVANEIYSEGTAMANANMSIIARLEENINPNSDLYISLPHLRIRVKGGYNTNTISLSKVDFSGVTPRYFHWATGLYGKDCSPCKYSQMEGMFENPEFISYIESNDDVEFEGIHAKIVADVLFNSNNNYVIESYYRLLKSKNRLDSINAVVLCQKGYLSLENLFENIFEYNYDRVLTISQCVRDALKTCFEYKFNELMLDVIREMVSREVKIPDYDWRHTLFSSVVDRLEFTYINNIEIPNDKQAEISVLLSNFVFAYLSSEYYKFIVRNLNNELFKSAIGITEDEIRLLGQYLLTKRYVTDSCVLDDVKSLVYDEEHLAVESCKKAIKNYIDKEKKYEPNIDDLLKKVDVVKSKESIREYFELQISQLNKSASGDAKFMNAVRVMFRLRLITQKESIKIIKDRLDLPKLPKRKSNLVKVL